MAWLPRRHDESRRYKKRTPRLPIPPPFTIIAPAFGERARFRMDHAWHLLTGVVETSHHPPTFVLARSFGSPGVCFPVRS